MGNRCPRSSPPLKQIGTGRGHSATSGGHAIIRDQRRFGCLVRDNDFPCESKRPALGHSQSTLGFGREAGLKCEWVMYQSNKTKPRGFAFRSIREGTIGQTIDQNDRIVWTGGEVSGNGNPLLRCWIRKGRWPREELYL